MPDKPWYTSITLWGGFVMALGFIVSQFGFNLTAEEQTQLTNFLVAIASAVGGIAGLVMVIIGRKKAGDQIKNLKSTVLKMSVAPKAISIPQTLIDLSNQVMGKETTTLFSTGIFFTTEEGKKLIESVKAAIISEKGKLLIDQFKKLGET